MASRTRRKIDIELNVADKASSKINQVTRSTRKAAAATGDLEKSLTHGVKTTTKFNKEQQTYLLTADRMRGSTSGLRQVIGRLRNTILLATFALAGMIATIKESIRAANEMESALLGLSSVARNTGQAIQLTEDAAVGLTKNGLLTVREASEGLRNLLASGFGLKEAKDLMDALTNSASFNRQGTLAMGQAIVGATQGIKNQNSIMVDNAGITKNLSVLYREYALTIGKTVGVLDEAEKRQAIYNGILREARFFAGDAAKVTQTLNGQISRLKVETFETSSVIGQALQPALSEIIARIANASKAVREWIRQNDDFVKNDLVGTLKALAIAALEVGKAISTVGPTLIKLVPLIFKLGGAFVVLKASAAIFNRLTTAVRSTRLALLAYETAALAANARNQAAAVTTVQATANAGGLSAAMTRLSLAANTTSVSIARQALLTKQLSQAQIGAALSTSRFAIAQGVAGVSVRNNIGVMAKLQLAMGALISGPLGLIILATVIATVVVSAFSAWAASKAKAREEARKLLDVEARLLEQQRKQTARTLETIVLINKQIEGIGKLKDRIAEGTSSAFKAEEQQKQLKQAYDNLNGTLETVADKFESVDGRVTDLNATQAEAIKLVREYNAQLVRTRLLENQIQQIKTEGEVVQNKLLTQLQRFSTQGDKIKDTYAAKGIPIFDNFNQMTIEGQKNLVAFADAVRKRAEEINELAAGQPELRGRARQFLRISAAAEEFAIPLRKLIALRKEEARIKNPLEDNIKVFEAARDRVTELARTTRGEQLTLEYTFRSPGGQEELSGDQFIGTLSEVTKRITELQRETEKLGTQALTLTIDTIDFDELFNKLSKGFAAAAKDSPAQALVSEFGLKGSLVANAAQTESFRKSQEAQLALFKEKELEMTELARRLGVSREQLRAEIVNYWQEKRQTAELENIKAGFDRNLNVQLTHAYLKNKLLDDLELTAMDARNEKAFRMMVSQEERRAQKQIQLRRQNLKNLLQIGIDIDPRISADLGRSEALAASGVSGNAGVNRSLGSGRSERVEDISRDKVQRFREALREEQALLSEGVAGQLQANEQILNDLKARTGAAAELFYQEFEIRRQLEDADAIAAAQHNENVLQITTEQLQRVREEAQVNADLRFRSYDIEKVKAFEAVNEEIVARKLQFDAELVMALTLKYKKEIIAQNEYESELAAAKRSIELERMTGNELLNIRRGLAEASMILPNEVAASFANSFEILGDRLVGNTEGTTLKMKELSKGLTDFEAKLLEIQVQDKQKAFKKELSLRKAAGSVAIAAASAATAAIIKGLAAEASAKATIAGGDALKAFAGGHFAEGAGHLAAAAKYGAVSGTLTGVANVVSKRGQREVEQFREQADKVGAEVGGDGATTSGRKTVGGTLSAQNLSITIAPSVTIEASGDIFLSDGSLTELESNIGSMAVNSIQEALDTNQIDISRAVGLAN